MECLTKEWDAPRAERIPFYKARPSGTVRPHFFQPTMVQSTVEEMPNIVAP